MSTLDDLAGMSDEQFELARYKLIREFIESAPEELRKKLLLTQYELDIQRELLSPEEFMQHLMLQINENMENLSDQALMLAHLTGQKPPNV